MTYTTLDAQPGAIFRSNYSGIIFPELVIFETLRTLPVLLKSGQYASGDLSDPVFSGFSGLPEPVINGIFTALRKQPVRISHGFPSDTKLLPYVTIILESMDPAETIIGDDGGSWSADIIEEDNPIVLLNAASGGEKTFKLPNSNIVANSLELVYERAGTLYELYESYEEFSIDLDNGIITLASGLLAGDKLTANSYKYYDVPGGSYSSTVMSFSVVIFVDCLSPLITMALSGLIWRELMTNKTTLEGNGISDLNLSIRTNSLLGQEYASLGFRKELVVTGTCEWHAFSKVDDPKTIRFDFDSTSGDFDSIVLYQDELASLGILDE